MNCSYRIILPILPPFRDYLSEYSDSNHINYPIDSSMCVTKHQPAASLTPRITLYTVSNCSKTLIHPSILIPNKSFITSPFMPFISSSASYLCISLLSAIQHHHPK